LLELKKDQFIIMMERTVEIQNSKLYILHGHQDGHHFLIKNTI